MRLRRRDTRFRDLIERQLDLFEREQAELVREADEAEAAYVAAGRGEAEELYGDYLLVVEAGTEALAELRDTYAATLDEEALLEYERAFGRAVAKRLPRFALGL